MSIIILESVPLDPVIKTWLTRVPRPSAGYLKPLNRMIRGMRSDGNLTELDFFQIGATELQSQAQWPIITTASVAITEVNAPTWTALQGYTGNGTNMYLNLNWTANTNSVKHTLNSASFGVYSRTDSTSVNTDMGASDATNTNMCQLYSKYTDNKLYIRVHQGTGLSDKTVDNSLALKSAVRKNSTTIETWSRGVSLGTNAINSTGMANVPLFVLAYNNNGTAGLFSSRQISMVYTGSGSLNQLTFYNRFQTFATEIGFNV